MTRAMDPEVSDAIWAAVKPLVPPPDDSHPLGCHNPRVADEVCFRGLLIRLVTGSSWTDIEAIMDYAVSDTTLRRRRDEWIAAGVFDRLRAEALAAFDRIVGLDLGVVAVDGSIHKAPGGGEGTGKSPVDRGKLGWKWSVAAERHGIPIGWSIDGANRNDVALLGPTLDAVDAAGLHHDIGTLSLDRSYDYPKVRAALAARGITDLDIQRRGTKPPPGSRGRLTLGLRWIVEATNTWWSNYGQLRRNTDRKPLHRHAALCLATAILITARLIDHRNRWTRN
ncbi:IS5 family transposase [Candidatus Poriferisodalis sp.]|uniref:IS5 family transposase n=1 Tax=Candidatus Poriferisodalis sp. TaxID=3101277 RepID=UPI003B02549B